ncbi:MAG: hypothetical protein M1840_006319 [Geoglossum simile]|nr:MAG: hypothetical protein M1840_006319 [Geoglossum simile]
MADMLLDIPTWDFPTWNLKEVALIVVFPTDELSFLQANQTAVHPSFTPYGTWEAGQKWSKEGLTNRHDSDKSQAETDIPDACPAVLLLSKLPKNGRAYVFGRESRNTKLDVVLPKRYVSRRQFCVYPNLLHQTWVIQDLSGKNAIVNGSKISSKESDQEPPSRVLQYDRLNRVVLAQTSTYPGITLFIKPVWPKDSRYLMWDWQDIPDLTGLNLCSTLTSLTATQSQGPELPRPGTLTKYCVLERTVYGIDVFFGQNLETGEMLAAEKFSSKHEAREQFHWRKKLQVVRAAYFVFIQVANQG